MFRIFAVVNTRLPSGIMAEAEVEDKTESEGHGPKQDEHLSSSKKPRKRCKKICAQIRNQVRLRI